MSDNFLVRPGLRKTYLLLTDGLTYKDNSIIRQYHTTSVISIPFAHYFEAAAAHGF